MSRRAAQLLGFEGQGTAKVRVQIMVPESIQAASLAGRRGTEPALAAAAPAPVAAPVGAVATTVLSAPPGVAAAPNQPAPLPPAPTVAQITPPASQPITDPPLPQIVQTVPVTPTGIYIQAGAFSNVDNAVRLKTALGKYGSVTVTNTKVSGMNMYRVRVGPVPSVDQADALLNQVIATSPDARIVVN
jgi:rare lipoprotein A